VTERIAYGEDPLQFAELTRPPVEGPFPIVVFIHSAGGHLALWVGQRQRLPGGYPGADPEVVPRLVVGQAPVAPPTRPSATRSPIRRCCSPSSCPS
jgi:acetyl esterase/lipase